MKLPSSAPPPRRAEISFTSLPAFVQVDSRIVLLMAGRGAGRPGADHDTEETGVRRRT